MDIPFIRPYEIKEKLLFGAFLIETAGIAVLALITIPHQSPTLLS